MYITYYQKIKILTLIYKFLLKASLYVILVAPMLTCFFQMNCYLLYKTVEVLVVILYNVQYMLLF